jgi:hypothetical protein
MTMASFIIGQVLQMGLLLAPAGSAVSVADSDNFNRTDEYPAQGWDQFSVGAENLKVKNNQGMPGTDGSGAYRSVDLGSDFLEALYLYGKLRDPQSDWAGYYAAFILVGPRTYVELRKRENGNDNALAPSVQQSFSVGDSLQLTITKTMTQVFVNGALKIQVAENSSGIRGYGGVYLFAGRDEGIAIDNYYAAGLE